MLHISLFKDEKAKQALLSTYCKPGNVLALGPKGVNSRGISPTYLYRVYKLKRTVHHTKLQNNKTKSLGCNYNSGHGQVWKFYEEGLKLNLQEFEVGKQREADH